MFNNVGSKIKSVAQLVTLIGILVSVISGIVVTVVDSPIGLIIIVAGSIASWLLSLTLYGFGQLIENTDILVANSKRQETEYKSPTTVQPATSIDSVNTPEPKHKWRCPKCGKMINDSTCPFCGNKV